MRSVAFSPDGTRILTGGEDGTAKVWDARTGTPLLELKAHGHGVERVVQPGRLTRIVTGSDAVYGRDGEGVGRADGHAAARTQRPHGRSGELVVQPGRLAASSPAVDDGTAKVWDCANGYAPCSNSMGTRTGCASVGVVQPGRLADRHRQWRPDGEGVGREDGPTVLELKGHTLGVSSVSFSPDGSRIVTGSWDRTAKVWDARTGMSLLELKGHTGLVSSVCVQPRRLADRHRQSGQTAKVRDARTGQEVKGELIHLQPGWPRSARTAD